jgi:hypothetical protein
MGSHAELDHREKLFLLLIGDLQLVERGLQIAYGCVEFSIGNVRTAEKFAQLGAMEK